MVKDSLKRWNRVSFGNIQQKIRAYHEDIVHLQSLPPSPSNDLAEQESQWLLYVAQKNEEDLWKSKSCLQWQSGGLEHQVFSPFHCGETTTELYRGP